MARTERPRTLSRTRKRHRFTQKEQKRGYQAALAKCMQDWNLYAWFYYRIRGYYRKRRRP